MNVFAMHDAVKYGDLEKVKQLIEAGVPVDSLNERGQTPLHLAAFYRQDEVAALLIYSKCNVHLKDQYGNTPVMLAAKRGKKDIVDLLLHRGAQVNCVHKYGRTLLHYASRNGWAGIVRLILDNGGADLNAVDRDGCTPLMVAVKRGQEEIAALLIRAGADVNRRDLQTLTVLHRAVKLDSTRVLHLLLEKEGLDLSPQDVYGDTPLHLACWRNQKEALKLLLDAGADTNVQNCRSETALSMGICRRHLTHEEIRLFVQKGAFLENCDYECISRNNVLKKSVLKDLKLCTQSFMNQQSLPALNSIAYFAGRLPNVDNFKLGAQQVDEVRNLVKCGIERNTFCNVVKEEAFEPILKRKRGEVSAADLTPRVTSADEGRCRALDESDAFGQMVAIQIRKFGRRNQVVAKNTIQNFLFKMEMGEIGETPAPVQSLDPSSPPEITKRRNT